MKRSTFLPLLLTAALCLSGATHAQSQERADPVKGNGRAFSVETQNGQKSLNLGDCTVIHLTPEHGRRGIRADRDNPETVQQLFDELRAGQIIRVSAQQLQAWQDSPLDPYAYGRLYVTCQTPDPIQEPGYASLTIDRMDEQAGDAYRDVIRLKMHVDSSWRQSTYIEYIRSQALYDLIADLCMQPFTPDALRGAVAAEWGGDWNGQQNMRTEDADIVQAIAEIMAAGKRVTPRIKVDGGAPVYFTMPDGQVLAVYVAAAQDGVTSVESGVFYLIAGDALYTLDLRAVDGVVRVGGLRGFEGIWG